MQSALARVRGFPSGWIGDCHRCQRECFHVMWKPVIARQVDYFHRVVRRAGKGSSTAIVAITVRFVGEAIVSYFKAERLGRAVPGSCTKRKVRSRYAILAARIRERGLEKYGKGRRIDRCEGRNRAGLDRPAIRPVDKDMAMGRTATGRVFHVRNPPSGDPRRTIPDPTRVGMHKPPSGSFGWPDSWSLDPRGVRYRREPRARSTLPGESSTALGPTSMPPFRWRCCLCRGPHGRFQRPHGKCERAAVRPLCNAPWSTEGVLPAASFASIASTTGRRSATVSMM